MASKRKDKTADLPPTGPRNPDPITDAPGAHPIETGVGAALGGAAAGMAAGAAAGPVGAVVGTIAGAVAGGLGGKAVGEWIDPTTEDTWLKENFRNRPYVKSDETFENYAPVYQYGGQAEAQHSGKSFQEVEHAVRTGYDQAPAAKSMEWNRARPAVQDAYERTCQIRRERSGGNSNNPSGNRSR